jgi:hypothetical protein
VRPQPAPPFEASHFIAWGTIAAASLAAAVFGAPDLAARMALPFGLAATVGGFLIGNLVPGKLHGVLHPVVVTAIIANAGAALYGTVRGLSYDVSQKVYLAKVGGRVGCRAFDPFCRLALAELSACFAVSRALSCLAVVRPGF